MVDCRNFAPHCMVGVVCSLEVLLTEPGLQSDITFSNYTGYSAVSLQLVQSKKLYVSKLCLTHFTVLTLHLLHSAYSGLGPAASTEPLLPSPLQSEAEASYYHTHKLISTASLDGQTVQSDVLYTGKLETRFKNHAKNKAGAAIMMARLTEDTSLPTKVSSSTCS